MVVVKAEELDAMRSGSSEEVPPHEMLRYFEFGHLPPALQAVSGEIYSVAMAMDMLLPPSAQKDIGFQKLLEAKDCFVRAALALKTQV